MGGNIDWNARQAADRARLVVRNQDAAAAAAREPVAQAERKAAAAEAAAAEAAAAEAAAAEAAKFQNRFQLRLTADKDRLRKRNNEPKP
jgi:hypothetical protein